MGRARPPDGNDLCGSLDRIHLTLRSGIHETLVGRQSTEVRNLACFGQVFVPNDFPPPPSPRHLTSARLGVGSAAPPSRPTFDGYASGSALSSSHAEAQVAVPERRHEPGPVRRPAVARVVEPAPAAEHPVHGLNSAYQITTRR